MRSIHKHRSMVSYVYVIIITNEYIKLKLYIRLCIYKYVFIFRISLLYISLIIICTNSNIYSKLIYNY